MSRFRLIARVAFAAFLVLTVQAGSQFSTLQAVRAASPSGLGCPFSSGPLTSHSLALPAPTTQSLRQAGCPIPAPASASANASPLSPTRGATGASGPLGPSTGSAGYPSAAINGISCVTSSLCVAVGSYTLVDYPAPNEYTEWTLVELWNGSTWTTTSSPNDWNNSDADFFDHVSCSSATFCVATGRHLYCYISNGYCLYYDEPFAASWNGNAWAFMSTPMTTANADGVLWGVSCASSSDCVAVGSYEDANSSTWYNVLEWNGASWVEEDPDPQSGSTYLFGVECQNVPHCIAVGGYAGGDNVGEIEQENAGNWTTVSSPPAHLEDVNCTSASFCMAVGYSSGIYTDEWNGTTWSPVSVSNPARLLGVSCVSATMCFAGGTYSSSTALIESWNGTSWSVASSPTIASLGTVFGSMACVNAMFCVAAGSYEYGALPGCYNCQLYGTLTDNWNGSSWSLQYPLSGGPITSAEAPTGNQCYVCALREIGQTYAGDPVNTEFGNLVESATDITIPGRGVPLQFLRAYDSIFAGTNGPLGFGWTSNWLMSLSQPGGSGPVTVTQENGARTVFTSSGSAYAPAAPRDLATLTHNSNGTWTFTRLAQDTFTFSATGQLTSVTDRNGYTTSLAYNGNGQLSTVTDASSRTLIVGWTGSNITTVTDNNVSPPRVVAFQYNDGHGNLTDATDVNGGHTHFAYNATHQLTNLYDPNCYAAGSACDSGNGVSTDYNAAGQVDWQKDQLGRKTTLAYSGDPTSSAGGTTTITDPKGNVTVDAYEYGVRIQETRGYGTPQAATTQWIYDPQSGAPITKIAPNGEVTQWTDDANGNVAATIDPLGRQSSATYNAFNEPLTQTDGTNVTTSYTYDTNGNLTKVSRPLAGTSQNQVTTYTYGDPSHPGDVTAMVDADNQTWEYAYDGSGDQVEAKDPLGNVAASVFNPDGWLLASYSPKATCTWGSAPPTGCSATYETTYGYTIAGTNNTDEFGDVQSVTDPLGHSAAYGYDADRNRTSSKDGDANLTTYVFDLSNELTQTKRADTPQTTVTTDYNTDGTVLDQKDGKSDAIQTYGYDPLGRVTTATDAVGNVTTFTFDGNGNQLTQQDPGGNCAATPAVSCTTKKYDADNELTAITYSDGVTPNVTKIAYGNDGQRTGMTDGTGTSSWTWDSLHRLTGFTNGAGATVAYDYLTPNGTYDLKDQVGHINYPGSVGTVVQAWDPAGRLASTADWNNKTTRFTYDADSNLAGIAVPSSTPVNDTFGFSAADRMSSAVVSNGSTLFSATYARDADAQLASDTSVSSSQSQYKYTALNQLCYAGSSTTGPCSNPPSGSYPYGFDAADNLINDNRTTQQFNAADELCWTLNGTSTNPCANAPSGAMTYAYDSRGNRTSTTPSSGMVTCDTYDQGGRLKLIATGSNATCSRRTTTVGTYTSNGDGLRMSKTVGTTTTQFRWDESSSVPLLLQEAGTTTTSYIYGPGGIAVEQISGSTSGWLHHDQLGSTRLITDATGVSVATYTFDPFGNLVVSTGTASTNLRYAGQYRDAESGVYYLRTRYYDPSTGQFLSKDPAVSLTRQPYSYVGGNPLNRGDPTGLDCSWNPFDNGSCLAAGWNDVSTDVRNGFVEGAPIFAPVAGAVQVGANFVSAACGLTGDEVCAGVATGVSVLSGSVKALADNSLGRSQSVQNDIAGTAVSALGGLASVTGAALGSPNAFSYSGTILSTSGSVVDWWNIRENRGRLEAVALQAGPCDPSEPAQALGAP